MYSLVRCGWSGSSRAIDHFRALLCVFFAGLEKADPQIARVLAAEPDTMFAGPIITTAVQRVWVHLPSPRIRVAASHTSRTSTSTGRCRAKVFVPPPILGFPSLSIVMLPTKLSTVEHGRPQWCEVALMV